MVSYSLFQSEPMDVISIISRWTHVGTAIVLVGGICFLRFVLAPAAAFLAEGGNPDDLGPQISDPILLPSPPVAASHTEVTGSVIYVDPYGNLITNIRPHHLLAPLDDWQVEVGSLSIDRISLTYGANAPGEVVGLFGSDNRLEIAVVCGSAEGRLGVGAGASVRLCRRQEAVS